MVREMHYKQEAFQAGGIAADNQLILPNPDWIDPSIHVQCPLRPRSPSRLSATGIDRNRPRSMPLLPNMTRVS